MYVNFVGMETIRLMDNKATHVRPNYSPALKINKMLYLKMGWLKERSPGNYDLGPNLRQEFFTDTVPNLETTKHDLKNDRGEPLFWLIGEELFHLSVNCNWRFRNLYKAFQNVVGSTSRSLFIYTDVGGGSVVGGIKSSIYCERSIIDAQGMKVVILNRSTFNIFRCAKTCRTL